MVVCSKCGATVVEGKFCEKCGSPLVASDGASGTYSQSYGGQGSSTAGGFFDKISSSMNKAASDLMAIKSDYSNGTLIYMVKKVPNVQEKKVKVEDTEVVFYNRGNGFTKYNQTFMTQDREFLCFYVRNVTPIQYSCDVEFKSTIKNLNDTDLISVKASYSIEFIVSDVDLFFNSLISMRQDDWKMIDVNSMLSTSINKIISENITGMLKEDGNLDLRDIFRQINKFSDKTIELLNELVVKYGLKVNTFRLFNAETNVYDVNKILIDNLYKSCQ